MLTGYATPIHEQPIAIREAILDSWRTTYLLPMNAVYKSMLVAGKNVYLKTSPTLHRITGFPTIPENYKPGKHYEYQFETFEAGEEPAVFETDVVIVGSGCGGSVCAKNLAEAGHRVLVVEKGHYFRPESYPMKEEAALEYLYENSGVLLTDDGGIAVRNY